MNDEATFRKNIELWAQQYNQHDAAALAAWYTKDCVYLTPTGLALVGPDQIRQYFQSSFEQSPLVAIAIQIEQFITDKPDLVVARGTFEVTNLLDPTGTPVPMKGPWVATFARRDERWIPLTHAAAMAIEAFVPAHV